MSDEQRNYYEGMFLFPQSASMDLMSCAEHLQDMLTKIDAEVIAFSKWDERRLAYEIKGNKRGLYFLVYFAADPLRLAELERMCNLSERLLRSMVTRADHLTLEEMQAHDAREKLSDEARLRSEKESGAESSSAKVESDASDEAEEPEPAGVGADS